MKKPKPDYLREVYAGHKMIEADQAASARGTSEPAAPLGALASATCSAFTLGLWQAPFRYEAEGTMVVDAHGERILDVRGWGYLTGWSSGALGLPEEKAAKVQDEIGASVAAMLTALWQNPGNEPRRSEA